MRLNFECVVSLSQGSITKMASMVTDRFCDICGKLFKNNFVLKTHNNDIHTKENQFSCDTCNYICTRKSMLKKHEKIHNNTRPLYNCDKCEKQFLTTRSFI